MSFGDPKTGEVNDGFVQDELPPYSYSDAPEAKTNGDAKPESKAVDTVDVDAETGDGDGAAARANWDNPIEFLLSCIAMSVGLGNIWRFPFVALRNGGGAFLIPYLIVLMVIGRPMYYLEMCLGQFCSRGQVKAWRMAPFFKGVGYTSALATFATVTFYSVLIAITVFYFFASFAGTLPWSKCNEDWFEFEGCGNETVAAFYFTKEAFPQWADVNDGLGLPNWRLALTLLFAWIAICVVIIKGVKSSGKVAYFTAIFPYVVLLVLLVRGVTLPGAGKGIEKFFKPNWSKLVDPKVWYEAVGQCFFSLTVGFGPIVMFSSYNPFRHNIARDALIISFMDTFTSLLAGVTIFSILGFLSEKTGQTIEQVAGNGGAALAFIAYPSALSSFPGAPQVFAVLFFLMLFTLGLGSATSLTGGVITLISDNFPKYKTWQITVAVCTAAYLIGLMYITPGGLHILDLVDQFAANFVIYVAAMVEVAAISYVYGLNNFCQDIEFMLNRKVNIYYKICWGGIIPIGLFVILMYWAITYESPIPENAGYNLASQVCAWLLSSFAVSLILIFGIHSVMKSKGNTLVEKFKTSLKPRDDWGPVDKQNRKDWIAYKQGVLNK